jgi:type II secretory pathway pseudopilin PulG
MKTKTKGLEPIVAAVLLIVVAVIGAVLVYLWFTGFVTKATSQAEQMTASEKLKIEAANLTSIRGALFIRNLGGHNVTISTIYIMRPDTTNPLCTATTLQVFRGTNTATGTVPTLFPGRVQLVRFDVPANCGVNAGYDYVIKVVTQKGTEFAVTVTAS